MLVNIALEGNRTRFVSTVDLSTTNPVVAGLLAKAV